MSRMWVATPSLRGRAQAEANYASEKFHSLFKDACSGSAAF